jgi:hypothetical protein
MKYVLLAMAVLFTAGLAFAADCCGCKCAKWANVRPAIAGAEPELAYWGVYPSGYTPLFFSWEG